MVWRTWEDLNTCVRRDIFVCGLENLVDGERLSSTEVEYICVLQTSDHDRSARGAWNSKQLEEESRAQPVRRELRALDEDVGGW